MFMVAFALTGNLEMIRAGCMTQQAMISIENVNSTRASTTSRDPVMPIDEKSTNGLMHSAVEDFITSSLQPGSLRSKPDTDAYTTLALQIQHNLQHQHHWQHLTLHKEVENGSQLPRPLLSGLPPRRLYVHPDEQLALIKAKVPDASVPVQREWVLPTHIDEQWTISHFSEVMDAIDTAPPGIDGPNVTGVELDWPRSKRVLLATLHNDSTVVYYIVHDGIVKPRQN